MNALADHLRPPGLMLKRGLLVFIVVLFFCDIAIYLSLAVSARLEPQYWIALLVVMGGALAWFSPQTRWVAFRTPVFFWCVLFLLLTLISYAAVPASHIEQLKERIRDVVLLTALLGVFVMLSPELTFLKKVIFCAVILGIMLNLVGLIEDHFLQPADLQWWHRSTGFYTNANESGIALIFGLLFSIEVLPQKWRAPYVAAVLVGIIPTFSREAVVGWVVGVICLCSFRLVGWRAMLAYGGVLVACIAVVGFITINAHIITSSTANNYLFLIKRFNPFPENVMRDPSSQERWAVLKLGWLSFLRHPFIGNGIGYTYHWGLPVSTHNMYLLYMDDYGIVGLFLYPLLVGCMVWKATGNTRHLAWIVAIFLLFWGLLDHNIVQNYYSLFAIALTAAMSRISADEAARQAAPIPAEAASG